MSQTNFGTLFTQYQDLYASLRSLLAQADGTVDVKETSVRLRIIHPEMTISEGELYRTVARAAEEMGRPLGGDGDGR